ncbi:alpha/beta hydrolase [Streptomyces sp. NPDC006368]|uniref:alpha/beta fold hydrolase n=1 Tax=Streptomyces sp. NPDC006368 TaxID=3156760 RepID=UPI0033BF4EA5
MTVRCGEGPDRFQHRREAAALRTAESWFAAAHGAYEAVWFGSPTDTDFDAAAPFFHGRWDAAAEERAAREVEQTNEPAADIHASSGAFDPAATRAALAGFEAPVLVLAGELDSNPRPRTATDTATLFPHAEVTVQPGAGHFPWLDDPVRFAQTVAAFLSQGRADSIR